MPLAYAPRLRNAEVRSGLSEGERVVIGTGTGAGSAPAAGPRMPRAPMGL